MKNSKFKIGAFLCAILVGLSCTGCSDTTWAIKYDNVKIPTGIYIYSLMTSASEVTSGSASSSSSSSSSSTASSSSGSSTANVWSKQIDNKSAVAWAMDKAMDQTKKFAAIEKLSADNKVTLTSTESSQAVSNADSFYNNESYKAIFAKNGVSITSIERIYKDYYLYNKLGTAIYGKGGKMSISDSDIKDYYNKNFVQIKQIFIAKKDLKTGTALTGSKLTDATNKANEAYAAAKADVANFDKYMKKYNEDTGETADSKGKYTGYIFDKAIITSSGNVDSKFTDLAFKLNVGEVSMTSSDMGYFIEYRTELDSDYTKNATFATSTITCQEQARSEMIADKISKYVEDQQAKIAFTLNNNTINKYNPKNIKLA